MATSSRPNGRLRASLGILWLATIGCGMESRPLSVAGLASAPESPSRPESEVSGEISQQSGRGDPTLPIIPRKIIYHATLTLVVEDSGVAGERIAGLVKEAGGYVAETDVVSDPRRRRTATWKVRVPVEGFDGFLSAVSRLGELQASHLDSQDVTQEYQDLEARIDNKQKEEVRLVQHLAESTGKLEDILAVERELSRVRGEVEQMQGRLRYLANVTALSTVTISVVELQNYTPPVAPDFATKASRTFQDSVRGLVTFGQGLALAVIASLPWLPVIAVPAAFAWLILRRVGRFLRPRRRG